MEMDASNASSTSKSGRPKKARGMFLHWVNKALRVVFGRSENIANGLD